MPIQPPFVLAAVLLLREISVCGSTVNLRGVSPELEARYSGDRSGFDCLDGSARVGLQSVNDDFCDCLDGSDEPGTSACSNGQFYCRNKGFLPLVLVAQFVDDGICDCCDGSDEGPGICGDKCMELSREVREDLQEKVRIVKEGLKLKGEREVEGVKMKKEWEAEVERFGPKVEAQKVAVERIRKEKEEADRLEEERAEKERKEKEKEVNDGSEGCNGESCPLDGPDGEKDQKEPPDDVEVGSDVSGDFVAGQPSQGSVPDENIETPEDTGVEAAAGECAEGSEICDGGVAEDGLDEADGEVDDDYQGDLEGDDDDFEGIEDLDGGEDCPEGDCGSENDFYNSPPEQEKSENKEQNSNGILGRVASIAKKVRRTVFGESTSASHTATDGSTLGGKTSRMSKELKDAERELRDLESQVSDLKKKLERDHGANDSYLSLEGKCFEIEDNKYKYEMCPFGSSKQIELGSSTSLGSWHGFDETGRWMIFSGGRHCWNGPSRSLRVGLACGNTDALIQITEPSVCEYIAYFQTPGACTQEELSQLQAELQSLDPEEDRKTEL